MAAVLFTGLVLFLFVGVLWIYIVRPFLEDWQLIAPASVSTFDPAPPATMDRSVKLEGQTGPSATRQTADARVSAPDPWIERMRLDRTRATLIEIMVYTGWSVGEIRGVLKGDNTVLSAEIEQARQRLGITEAPRVIPLSERGAPPRPLALDSDLHYAPPPR